jgi:hypothetical protein
MQMNLIPIVGKQLNRIHGFHVYRSGEGQEIVSVRESDTRGVLHDSEDREML